MGFLPTYSSCQYCQHVLLHGDIPHWACFSSTMRCDGPGCSLVLPSVLLWCCREGYQHKGWCALRLMLLSPSCIPMTHIFTCLSFFFVSATEYLSHNLLSSSCFFPVSRLKKLPVVPVSFRLGVAAVNCVICQSSLEIDFECHFWNMNRSTVMPFASLPNITFCVNVHNMR